MKLRLFALTLLLFAAPIAGRAAERVALVVGNGAYDYVQPLNNPGNDADDLSAALTDLGFDVLLGEDLSHAQMTGLIDRFAAAARQSDVALFYFAGHAYQVGGGNFLVPSDLKPGEEGDTLAQSVPLDAITAALEQAPGLKFLFLDACRDNPLGISAVAGGEGLARTGTAADFLVVYATQPGAVAFDGDGRNGIFTDALLNQLPVPGQTIGEMMIAVRRDVIAATGGQQIPWESSSLTREFQFDPGQRTVSNETLLYQVAARTRSADLMAFYLERYPGGAHQSDAESFLAAPPDPAGDGRSLPDKPAPSAEEDQLWNLVQRTRERELAAFYQERFPEGRHAQDASRLLETIPAGPQLGPGELCTRLATHPRDATAANAGVEFEQLRQNAALAIETCTAAVQTFPEQPRYKALLARATIAGGSVDEAVALYREAAGEGDLRAMVSLGLLADSGTGLPKDPRVAVEYYERAAEGGSPDGAINLAVALYEGKVVPKDAGRAVQLFRKAAAAGSPIAAFNLGVLARDGAEGDATEALDLFLRAAHGGEPRGFRAAAVLLDKGQGVAADPAAAASLLLRGAAEDRGDVLAGITGGADRWSPQTVRAMQGRLKQAGLYQGGIDGVIGPHFISAARQWRDGGFDATVLD